MEALLLAILGGLVGGILAFPLANYPEAARRKTVFSKAPASVIFFYRGRW